jgi:glycosyltransferase involved in cell wall biosynthesis
MFRSLKTPLILHFVTWYPTTGNHAEGIFIQRQIELLASNNEYHHIVVRKSTTVTSRWDHLKALFGFFALEKVGTLQVITIPGDSQLYRFFFWRFRKRLEQWLLNRLYIKYQPSLAHLHVVYGFGEEALYLKKEKNLPFLVSEHMGPFPFVWLMPKDLLIIQPMQQAARVVAVSEAQAKQIESFTGVIPLIIPNVINEKEFCYAAAPLQQENRSLLQIIFTGVYTKAKGGDYLLRVFPHFLKAHPGALLHMAGNATEERMKELTAFTRQAGIDKKVKFHGNLSAAQLNALYQQCDFYVCSSEWESFGLSVLEGLFTGLPALCTSCGGPSDFINKENGLLIANDQQDDTLLKGLLQMTELYKHFNRKQIAEQVHIQFSKETIQKKYLGIYRELIPASGI